MKLVCVLDMDETLGVFHNGIFHVRPKVDVLLQLLRLLHVDIILWSLGEDQYVQKIVNGFLPEIARHAFKIFARKESYVAKEKYKMYKAGEHIRVLYDHPIYLMGVDDCVTQNMDMAYDVRIYVPPYKIPNGSDRKLLKVCETLIKNVAELRL